MSRIHFAIIFAVLLLGYFLLFEGVTAPWASAPQVEAELEAIEPARPEMIVNPYVESQK